MLKWILWICWRVHQTLLLNNSNSNQLKTKEEINLGDKISKIKESILALQIMTQFFSLKTFWKTSNNNSSSSSNSSKCSNSKCSSNNSRLSSRCLCNKTISTLVLLTKCKWVVLDIKTKIWESVIHSRTWDNSRPNNNQLTIKCNSLINLVAP